MELRLNQKTIISDHFTVIIDFDIEYKKQKPDRQEVFDFKDPEGQQKFMNILNTEDKLTQCFNSNQDIETQVDNWFSQLNVIFGRSFKKIRLNGKTKETESSNLQKTRSAIIQSLKKDPKNENLKADLENVTSKLTSLVSENNYEKIKENFQHLDQTEGEISSAGIWKITKKEFPKNTKSAPSAKLDVNNRLISDPIGLKKLYSETFVHRLRQRPIKEDYSNLYELQKILLEKRLLLTVDEKSQDWTEEDLIAVLSSLKNGKCRDPLGMINEIFKPPIAGRDLVESKMNFSFQVYLD